ncbi:MAG: M48 family metallopeptidase [Bacteroidales bacterium]|jgi:STE24 endopeptidase|nr:M48 family metallopeptidase [Bacteroidales bacterium]
MITSDFVFASILIILIVDFVFGKWTSVLNYKWRKKPVPESVQDVYDEKEYKKFQDYSRVNFKIGLFSSVLMFILTVSMFIFDGFAFLDGFLRQYIDSEVWLALAFFAVIGMAAFILSLPFSIYDTFVIEEKFGFNKTNPKTFIFDTIKSMFVSAIIGGGLLALVILIWQATETWFWLLAWILISVFSIFMAEFYSSLIVPLFNKQTPLEAGSLRDKISEFADNAGFRLDNVFVIDGSKRSTRANAYFTGLGKKKRIVLYDTLINDFEEGEIVAVLAHEIGHFRKNHIRKSLIISTVNTGFVLFVFGLFVGQDVFSQALGVESASFHIGAIGFAVLYTPLSAITGVFMHALSRKNEREADGFATYYGYGKSLISALKKLSAKNLSNLTPHPLMVKLSYSHPPVAERIGLILKREK